VRTECYLNKYSLKDPNCLQGLVGDEDDTYLAVEFFTLALQHAIYQAFINGSKTISGDINYEQSL